MVLLSVLAQLTSKRYRVQSFQAQRRGLLRPLGTLKAAAAAAAADKGTWDENERLSNVHV
jgi:hypothetical protein